MAKKNNNIHEITINIEGEDWKKALDESFKKKVKDVTVDGFRKGKCPRNIYDKKVGIETLFDEAGNIVLQDAYTKAMEESKLLPVVQPDVNLKDIKEEVGDYKITYIVEDSSGNKTMVTRNVKILDKEKNIGTIYLTFDDGPSNNTSKILDILKKEDIKATFFLVNFNSSYNPVVKRIYDEGHSIGIHSYTHNYKLIYSSVNAYFDDLNKMNDKIKTITGSDTKLLRFPGGSSNTISSFNKGIMTTLVKEVTNAGYHYFDWNVDSSDAWSARNSNDVYNNVINNLKKGTNIVLMHDLSSNEKTINILEKIIKDAKEKGYIFENITMNTKEIHHGINN